MANIHIRTNPSTAYITDGGCNYYLDVEMLCVCNQLFLVTKKGALRDTDSIHLFRYSRTRNRLRYYADATRDFHNQVVYRRTRKGWQIPMRGNVPAVNLVMHKLSSDEAVSFHIEKIASVKDVWLVKCEDGVSLNELCREGVIITNSSLTLSQKKLGLRVKRGGEWITDYICFMFNGGTGGIGRWAR